MPTCTGSITLSMMALVPSRASSRLMAFDRSGPVAMRWMIERIRSLGSDGRISALINNSIRIYKNTNGRPNQSRIDGILQGPGKRLLCLRKGQVHAEVAAPRHRHAWVAAGVDRGERRQIHVDVEREPVIGAAVPDAQTQRGDLGAADVHPGRAGQPFGSNTVHGQKIDHRLLHTIDEFTDAVTAPPQVDQHVGDHPPQAADQGPLTACCRLAAHSAIFTHGWAVISRYSASSWALEVARTTHVTER